MGDGHKPLCHGIGVRCVLMMALGSVCVCFPSTLMTGSSQHMYTVGVLMSIHGRSLEAISPGLQWRGRDV